MYKGVWEPKNNMRNKILILGESHYDKDVKQGDESDFYTKDVVDDFLNRSTKERWHEFFYKIAKSFGYSRDNENDIKVFYNSVYFGNYVDVICGIGNSNKAKNLIQLNRNSYNESLFDFCNQHKIDLIICFSKAVYNAMPNVEFKGEFDKDVIEIGKIGNRRNLAGKTLFKQGKRKDCKTSLKKDLLVYGIRHPSGGGGYKTEQVYQFLSRELSKYDICK